MTSAGLRPFGALALVFGLALACADLAAPVLGPEHPAAWLARTALAPTCHQRPERSFARGGVPLASCARCTGIHLSGLAGGALLLLLPARAARRLPSPRGLVLLGLMPLLVDVGAGLLWTSWDHPWLRAATGLIAGCALLLTLRAAPAAQTETAR